MEETASYRRGTGNKRIGIFALIVAMETAAVGSAQDLPQNSWGLHPHGRAWSEFYAPHDPEAFWDIGLDLLVRFQTPYRFEPFLQFRMRSSAGYNYSTRDEGPPTPIDLQHQNWQQTVGIKFECVVPAYVFVLRDCNHQLDKGGFDPVLATTLMVGAGSLPPFRRDFHHFADDSARVYATWLIAAGPALGSANESIWNSQNATTAEGWLRALATYRVWDHGTLDVYGDLLAQASSDAPKWRHTVRNEVGLTLHSGTGGWRFYFGRQWRDTRALWPVDQRTFWGLKYVY